MLKPLVVKWFAWDQEPSVGGGYTCVYSPGTFVNMGSFCVRKPEGKIHWAGT
jgi:monoamine oxidase